MFRAVPIAPPTLPDKKLLNNSPLLVSALGNKLLIWKILPKYPPFQLTCLQKVASMPTYNPNGPDFPKVCLTTSRGPAKVDALSCRRILTSSKGVTRKDSVAPAAQPVAMATDWVMGMVDFLVNTSPQKALAATASRASGAT